LSAGVEGCPCATSCRMEDMNLPAMFSVKKEDGTPVFLPIDLLEASLAACINVTLRMYAHSRKMKPADVVVTVSLNKDAPENVFVKENIEFMGAITEKERKTLFQVASQCTVARTLRKKFSFEIGECLSERTIK
jgi:putative redox protein